MTHDTASAPVPLQLPGSGDWLAWVAERTEGQLAEAKRYVEQVKTGSPDEVLAAWNRAETAIANAEVAHLWSEVHPDAAVRGRADELSQEVQKYVTELGDGRAVVEGDGRNSHTCLYPPAPRGIPLDAVPGVRPRLVG